MKAIAITRPGGPEVLELVERPTPSPGDSEIRVRVRASAINRADLLQRRGHYPAPPGAPADIPGLEYAGEVEEAGRGVGMWNAGDRVMGIVGGGGHAEYVCVHEGEAVRVPADMDWEDAAAIPEAFMTAWDAMVPQAEIVPGERVLIHAVASGVGTAAVQIARELGAITLGTSRTPAKLDEVMGMDLGLDHAIDASGDEWEDAVREVAGDSGIDVTLDLVGGGYHPRNVRLAAVKGRIVVIGLIGGARAEMDLGLLLRKRLCLMGTVMRTRTLDEKIALARAFSEAMVPAFEAGRLRPVIDTVFPFEEIGQAHKRMESNISIGKVVLNW